MLGFIFLKIHSCIHEVQIAQLVGPTFGNNFACFHMNFFIQKTFSYQDAITSWKDQKV